MPEYANLYFHRVDWDTDYANMDTTYQTFTTNDREPGDDMCKAAFQTLTRLKQAAQAHADTEDASEEWHGDAVQVANEIRYWMYEADALRVQVERLRHERRKTTRTMLVQTLLLVVVFGYSLWKWAF